MNRWAWWFSRAVMTLAWAAGLCAGAPAPAEESYRRPPEEIVKVLEAPPFPAVSLDPARSVMLLLEPETLPPVRDLAQPMLRLAGARVNPRTNGPHGARAF